MNIQFMGGLFKYQNNDHKPQLEQGIIMYLYFTLPASSEKTDADDAVPIRDLTSNTHTRERHE